MWDLPNFHIQTSKWTSICTLGTWLSSGSGVNKLVWTCFCLVLSRDSRGHLRLRIRNGRPESFRFDCTDEETDDNQAQQAQAQQGHTSSRSGRHRSAPTDYVLMRRSSRYRSLFCFHFLTYFVWFRSYVCLFHPILVCGPTTIVGHKRTIHIWHLMPSKKFKRLLL